ncbi:MAG: formylglycine-generating enzyme family protein, partial [Polyangiales bacterium]
GKLFAVIGVVSVALAGVAIVVARSGSASDDTDEKKPAKHKAKDDAPAPVALSTREKVERLNPFLGIGSASMQRHEVTREEYAIFLNDLPEAERSKMRPLSEWTSEKLDADSKHQPVTWVSFERARRFCKAIDAKYPWGADWPDDASGLAIGKGDGASPIAVETSKFDKTADGIRDLAGNVQEWTSTVADGLATVRGGSIAMSPEDAKAAISEGLSKFTEEGAGSGAKTEAIAGARLGFRCVRSR